MRQICSLFLFYLLGQYGILWKLISIRPHYFIYCMDYVTPNAINSSGIRRLKICLLISASFLCLNLNNFNQNLQPIFFFKFNFSKSKTEVFLILYDLKNMFTQRVVLLFSKFINRFVLKPIRSTIGKELSW